MSLYGEYIAEREGKHILEDERGFITYIFLPDGVCFINDMYIKPEYRRNGVGTVFFNALCEISREFGCNKIMATVCPQTNNATDSLKAILAVGFELKASTNTLIYLERGL